MCVNESVSVGGDGELSGLSRSDERTSLARRRTVALLLCEHGVETCDYVATEVPRRSRATFRGSSERGAADNGTFLHPQ
jgi:hypothetical protein